MLDPLMSWTNAIIDVLLFFYVIVCGLMGLVIMMQRSKQEGLGAAFGGGITDSLWGAQTSQVLVKTTVWLAILFFVISITLARLYAHKAAMKEETSPLQQQLMIPVAPTPAAATPPPVTAPVTSSTAPTTPAPVAPTPTPATPDKPAAK